jgi:nucleotide-binding universal stress UspA family protein
MEDRSPFTHILVPTDGSDTSINAGLLAIQIAATHRAQLTFIYVVDQIVVDGIASATSRSTEVVSKELENKGQHYLDYLSRAARDTGLRTDQVIRRGIPHREIAELARERHGDLIVIGQVGSHGFQRAHIGSVAERVIECAPCPVLVVRHTPTVR